MTEFYLGEVSHDLVIIVPEKMDMWCERSDEAATADMPG